MRRTAIACALALGLGLLCVPLGALANVAVTAASGGTSLSADRAQNGAAPLFTTLGNIVIAEPGNSKGDIAAGANVTLILTAPSGWSFNAGVGTVSFTTGNDITTASVSAATSAITVTITVGGTSKQDTLTISGIQVQATDGGNIPASGNFFRASGNPGTATIAGIVNDSTSFGALSQTLGALRLYVVLTGQS